MGKIKDTNKKLAAGERGALLKTLESRFEKNMSRHKGLTWLKVVERLETHPQKMWSLFTMEQTGGEPDVVGQDKKTGEFLFFDCSPESPAGRRSVCYDGEALAARKEHKPADSAVDMAGAMGIEILTEEQYFDLQRLGHFDTKTSSWLKTPAEIRKLGGSIYGDFRYGRTFIGHNGADSYYAVRGFRGSLRI